MTTASVADCGSGAVLQRGSRGRHRGRRFSQGAAAAPSSSTTTIRGPHRRGRARGRRRGAQRTPPGQGACGAADVRRCRCRRLCAGRWRCDLRRAERPAHDRQAGQRSPRHGGGLSRRPIGRRLPARPPHRQLDADDLPLLGVRRGVQGHPVRLPRVLAPLRQILSGAVGRFEIETELSVHALELALPVAEIETPYYARPEGSFSKLNTWRDGFRILGTI